MGGGSGVTSDELTAKASDVLKGKLYMGLDTDDGAGTGTIPTYAGRTITPGTANQTIASGQYLGGNVIIAGDADLKAANIKSGVNIFGVAGSCKEYKKWEGQLTSSSARKTFGDMGSWYYLTLNAGFDIQVVTGHGTGNTGHELIGMDAWNYIVMNSDNSDADYFYNGIPGIDSGTTWYLPVYQRSCTYYIMAFGY